MKSKHPPVEGWQYSAMLGPKGRAPPKKKDNLSKLASQQCQIVEKRVYGYENIPDSFTSAFFGFGQPCRTWREQETEIRRPIKLCNPTMHSSCFGRITEVRLGYICPHRKWQGISSSIRLPSRLFALVRGHINRPEQLSETALCMARCALTMRRDFGITHRLCSPRDPAAPRTYVSARDS